MSQGPKADTPGADSPRLVIRDDVHEFGSVVEGDVLVHSFVVANAGPHSATIEVVRAGRFCTGTLQPETVLPGSTAALDVTCRLEGAVNQLDDRITIRSKGTDSREAWVTLQARVMPVLAFDTRLLEFDLPFGEQRSADVHLVGIRSAEARLTVKVPGDAGFAFEPLAAQGGKPGGLRVRVHGTRVGINVGNLVVATGLPKPAELTLPYSCKVRGTLEIQPTNPYLDLRASGPKRVRIVVRSTQPGFVVRGVDVAEGPFTASVEREASVSGVVVTVGLAERPTGENDDTRGVAGKVIVRSNDAAEPKKAIPIFAFGQR